MRRFSPLWFLVLSVAALACGGTRLNTALVEPPPAQAEVSDAPVIAYAPLPPAPPREALPSAWAAAPTFRFRAPGPPEITAQAAIVIDEASGAVLYEKEAHVPLAPASLTKIATLILALEHGDLDAWVDIDVDWREMRGSTVMGLIPGDRFILHDLLYGLMLPSGNDAALAIGRFIAGSDAAFVGRMNGLLYRLGLDEGQFANAHGLGNTSHNISTYALGMLSRYGMSLPGFQEISTAPRWTARGNRTLIFSNINTFLYVYPGADGVKSGYTRRSGNTLAASATRNGHRVYAIVFNAPGRDSDASRLLNWAFTSFTWP
jgi:D-alanyl-D-alanine carboxypeptidase